VAPDVCVVGEINPDLILYGLPKELKPEQEAIIEGFQLTLGGSSAIFAHNLAVLGTRVSMIAKVGCDPMGKLSLEWLEAAGVDTAHILRSANGTPTGITVILAQPEHRFMLTYPGTMSELAYDELDLVHVLSARHLHLASYFLHRGLRPKIAELFRNAKAKGLTTSLDTNDDPEGQWSADLMEVLPSVDIFFPNEREAKKITQCVDLQQAMTKLSKLTRLVVVKLGAEGARSREGSREWSCPGLNVDTIDSVGAGDSFDAGYIHRFLEGASPQDCLEYANRIGAFSTTRAGGTEAFRNREYLSEFLRRH
jgi:sugar/nucleoside kinase (ribokinase family)